MMKALFEHAYLYDLRKRNHNKDPTIITNNCVGGVIYHNLGLRFLSPTINLFLPGEDFLRFVKDMRYYIERPLVDITDELSLGYPVGRLLGDESHGRVQINFQHYGSFGEASDKWQERCGRINWENMYYIYEFYDKLYPKSLIEEFDRLPIKKLCILHRDLPDIHHKAVVDCYDEHDGPIGKILQRHGLLGRRYLEQIDYVGFLNS